MSRASIQCTFVVNNVASKMKSQARSSCMTLHNGLFLWLLYADGVQNIIQYCLLKVYLKNNEPGTTRYILYKIIIFKLLLIHAINKIGV